MVRTWLPPVDYGDVGRLAVAALHPSLKQVIDPGYHRPLGTEILHQPQGLFRDESLEARHHFHVGAPEAVDGLFRVPNNEQLARGQGDIGPPVGAVQGVPGGASSAKKVAISAWMGSVSWASSTRTWL